MRYLIFFLRLYVWFSLRNLRRHPGRTLTVLFGIALGAAVFTSMRLSVQASLDSFVKSMDLIAGRTEHVLIRPGGYVPENLISILLKHPAVHRVSPLLTTYVQSPRKNTAPFLLIGFDPILDRSIRRWRLADSGNERTGIGLDLLKDPYTLILGEPLSRQLQCGKGDVLTLEHVRQKRRFRVLGKLAQDGLALVEGGRVALTDIATFQEFTGLYGQVDRIDLKLKSNAAEDLENLRKVLPHSTVLTSPSAARESGRIMIGAYRLNLSILSFASLFVGMFLVYSLVALNAASRRQELAILRSIGAPAHLIFIIFLAEGAFFGIFGWIMAIPVSSFLVKYMLQGVSQTISTLFVRVAVETLSLNGWEILLSFGITLAVTVVAAAQPAREAMQVAPKEALEISRPGIKLRKSETRLALAGLICIFLVLPLSQLPGILGMPLPGYLAIFLLFVGFP